LQDLKSRGDLTFVFISHDLAVVQKISNRVAVMYAGEVVETGTVKRVFETPQHWYTKELMAAVPSPDPRRGNHRPFKSVGVSVADMVHHQGCSFASRCEAATQICRTDKPLLVQQSAQHAVACHHPDTEGES